MHPAFYATEMSANHRVPPWPSHAEISQEKKNPTSPWVPLEAPQPRQTFHTTGSSLAKHCCTGLNYPHETRQGGKAAPASSAEYQASVQTHFGQFCCNIVESSLRLSSLTEHTAFAAMNAENARRQSGKDCQPPTTEHTDVSKRLERYIL